MQEGPRQPKRAELRPRGRNGELTSRAEEEEEEEAEGGHGAGRCGATGGSAAL